MWMEAINDWNDFEKLSEILYVLITVTTYILKLIGYTYHTKKFTNLVENLDNPIFETYPEKLGIHVKRAIQLSTVVTMMYGGMCACVIIQYALMPFLGSESLPLPFPYETGSFTPLMYIFQVVGCGIAAWANGSLDNLTVGLMSIAAAHLDIVGSKLNSIQSKGQREVGSRRKEEIHTKAVVINCVRHHHATIT